MITPLQQTPIPLDPIRQQITPAAPIEAPAPPQPADQPVQASDSSKDKFDPKNDSRKRDRNEQALEDQQKAETARALRQAYIRLNELQRETNTAVAAGNASRAKELASEATEVAQTIPINVGVIETATQDQSGASGSGMDVPQAVDIGRAGLGTAKDVVDNAGSLPHHPIADRVAIDGMRTQVLQAMAGVEEIAQRAAEQKSTDIGGRLSREARRIDLKA